MDRKINILHINNSNILSQYLLSIGRLYDKNIYNLTIACFDDYGSINEELKKIGVKTFNIPIKKQTIFHYFTKMYVLYKYLKNNNIQILHLHTFLPSLIGVIVGKLARVDQIVMTRHHADSHVLLKKKWHIKIDGWTARHCNKVIAVSNFTKKIMVNHEAVPANRIKVIYNGIEHLKITNKPKIEYLNEFKINPQTIVFLAISRIHPDKNLKVAIKVIKLINDAGYDSTLLIAGAGIGSSYYNEIIALSTELNISSKIIFLGFRDDIGDLLSFSDALFHPSILESFGFSILEAMSIKKTVFASNIDAINEVATKSVANLFDPQNEIEISNLIIHWINNKKLYEQKLLLGFERCEKYFTFINMIKEYEKYYEEK